METVTTSDGRTLAYEVRGDPDGAPVIYHHGVPGSRLRTPLDPHLWRRLGVRAIAYDRPGYGASTRNEGRSVADCVPDVIAIADALGLDRFGVLGVSGGGPHALAVATLAPERVAAAALVVPFAPIIDAERELLIPMNQTAHDRARNGGGAALAEQIGPLRERVLADPVGALRATLGEGVIAEIERLGAPDAIARAAGVIAEGLRPGPGGWIDDAVANQVNWGFEPTRVAAPASVWYAESDTMTPASAVRRLAEQVGAGRVHAWPDEGHLASVVHEGEVLEALLGGAG